MPAGFNKYTAKVLTAIFFGLMTWNLIAQESDTLRKGIHQEENEYYSKLFPKDAKYDQEGSVLPSELITSGKSVTRMVLGWHPYWASSSAYLYYDYDVLSHIAFFSYEVDTATGGYTTIRGWDSTPVIDYAHQKGTKVLLTVTNFGSERNNKLLSDTSRQRNLINTLIFLLKSRNGDGVNFDFESVSFSQRSNLVNFIANAVTAIKSQIPAAEISMATPAVDWSNAFNLKALSELCDYLIVMGYNYYWSSSSTAGPVAPLSGETYNVTNSVNTYLNSGVVPEKLFLGVPWYGLDWPVVSDARKSKTTGTSTSRTYSAAQDIAGDHGKIFDQATKVPWISYPASSAWRQLWFEDSQSLTLKYNLVNSMNLGGTGIWALSYEGGYKDVWSIISNVFSSAPPDKINIVKIFPNPVKGIAEIQFTIPERADISVKIFDLNGRTVTVLADGIKEAGFHTLELNTASFGPGIYFCVLRAGKTISTVKIIITE